MSSAKELKPSGPKTEILNQRVHLGRFASRVYQIIVRSSLYLGGNPAPTIGISFPNDDVGIFKEH